jgi:hypothetical protein
MMLQATQSGRQRPFFGALVRKIASLGFASTRPVVTKTTALRSVSRGEAVVWVRDVAPPTPALVQPAQWAIVTLVAYGFLVGLVALLSGCQREPTPAPRGLDDLERDYIIFVHNEVKPMVERDRLRHVAGGCDVSPGELLCVECYAPGGEAWIHCSARGCALLDTGPEIARYGADLGVCERPEARQGLALSFTRRRP